MQLPVWIAIYFPIFVLLFVLIPLQQRKIYITRMKKKKGGVVKLPNELIRSCIGKVCNISGSLGTSFSKVKIFEVEDNWIKGESRGKEVLINTDFIQGIKVISNK